jgi:tRNA pseudouridine55 synthase
MSRKRKHARKVDGVLLLDKPAGMTSNAALQAVKHLFRARKAGHTGSLDPLATGLLPICLGEATKMSSYLLEADKRYWVRCRLGLRTETGDAEGKPIAERPVESYSEARIEQALDGFRGEIEQVPPMYSALKVQGRRLYELAREGVQVERPPRRVHVYELGLEAQRPDELELAIRCSKGTYVRTLVDDLGEQLGCGAHVVALRRTGVGPYQEQDMHTLAELEALAEQGLDALDERLLPVDTAVADWPRIELDRDGVYYLRQGQPLQVPRAPTEGRVALYGPGDRFLGVGEIMDDGRVAPKRLILQA